MDTLEKVLEELAFITWDTIGNAYDNRISYGEDAITSVNLLALKNKGFHNFVLEDTRINESSKGCDFEFWVGSNEKGWFRYAIQAKKITVSNQRYDALAHKVNGVPQIDILKNYARINQAIPLYCLFNKSVGLTSLRSGCPKFNNIKELGCSITPLQTVQTSLNTRGTRNFNWFHNRPETLPWSCLVRCPQISQHWSRSTLGVSHDEMMYSELPRQLALLLSKEGNAEEIVNSDIFSQEIHYRPRWVGVFETSEQQRKG